MATTPIARTIRIEAPRSHERCRLLTFVMLPSLLGSDPLYPGSDPCRGFTYSLAAGAGRRRPCQRGTTVINALLCFLDGVRAFRNLILQLDGRRDLPLVLAHHLEDVLDRRLASPPRQVER